ncbi:DUF4134 family protein [Pedobacter sp. R-06]|uniref:DUF4134 family protein n=1 Tax=Pedobacter sp. R-06 TaxID=3404051 RepID=UPI003CF2C2C5
MTRFRVFLLLPLVVLPLFCIGQPGLPEMEQATSLIRNSFFSMRDLSYVLAALIAVIGAVVIYHKWQMGKDVGTDIPAWFFSSIFVLLTGAFLSQLFGI